MVDLASEVTAAEVKTGIETQLSDSDINSIIDESADIITGKLELRGIDVDNMKTSDNEFPLAEKAVIYWSRMTVFDFDASAHRKHSRVREGDIDIGFAGQSSDFREVYKDIAEDLITDLVRIKGGKKPKIKMTRRLVGQNPFDEEA